MIPRPKRKAIPMRAQRDACLFALGIDPANVDFDHYPAIALRPLNDDGTDTVPPMNDPRYIVPMTRASHAAKTNGPAHDHSQGDKGKIAKVKRIERKQAEREAVRKTGSLWDPVVGILTGDLLYENKTLRPKRRIPSRPFPKRAAKGKRG